MKPRHAALLIVAGILFTIAAVVFANIAWAVVAPIPAFGQLQNRQVGESTKLYDRTGTVMLYDTAGLMRRTTTPLSAVSPYLINATIAIEDNSFYKHGGIRLSSIARAILTNVGQASLSQGGSTITQQVIKNTLLTKNKSFIRKIKEWVLALRIEQRYSKDEILETYLNETPYGGAIYGVEEASRAYFDKSAKDLTLSEAAYIAALPKAPTRFSPWGLHRDELTERHNLVLQKMLEYTVISEEEYKGALAEEVVFAERNTETIRAPHFVFYVLQELEKKYGKEKVYDGGLQVITTLDWELQQENEKIIREGALHNERAFNASNAGLVAIDPTSGEILSMVGSRDYFDDSVDGQVNVTLALRQPGSAFKPFVYATALAKGYTPETVLFDLKTQFSTACAPYNLSNEYPCYSPDNYDENYRGPITLREALAQSINVVAVKTLYLSGIENSISTARSLGITTLADAKRYGLTLVLGGGEVTLLEMTAAYSAFANDGVQYQTTPILSVRNTRGSSLYSHTKESKQVLDPEVARTINDILSDNTARTPAFGADGPLRFDTADVADKTGTTNDYRDAWVIGYTSGVVVGTWAGNNDNTPMVKRVASFILAPMWHTAMEEAIARFPSAPFDPPKKIAAAVQMPIATIGDMYSGVGVHEILYWVDKDNPLGGPPANPYADAQLTQWDYPVALWAGQQFSPFATGWPENGFAFGTGGRDGVPLLMSVTAPTSNSAVLQNQPFIATISHSELENVLRVSYYLDGAYVGSSETPPFSSPPIVVRKGGIAVILAVAESPLGNTQSAVTFTAGGSVSLNTQ